MKEKKLCQVVWLDANSKMNIPKEDLDKQIPLIETFSYGLLLSQAEDFIILINQEIFYRIYVSHPFWFQEKFYQIIVYFNPVKVSQEIE
jgi:hypothetical protein